MRKTTGVLWGLILAALVLGFVSLVGPPVGAVESGRDCDQGIRDGADCLIEVGPAISSQLCPVSAAVFEDGDECFELEATITACPERTTEAGDDCRETVDLVTYDTECPDTFTNLDGTCIRFDPSVPVQECPEGTVTDAMCEIVGAPPIAQSMTCVVSGDVMFDGDDCYRLVAQQQECPAGSFDDADGLCREPVELVPGPAVCEDGFQYIEGSCIRFSSPTPEGECDEGVLQGGVLCVAEGSFVPGPQVCPVSDDVVVDGDECFMFVQRSPLACPTGTTLDSNDVDCRQPVELTPSDFVCADGFSVVDEEFCVSLSDPLTVEGCTEGTLLAGGGTCIVQGGNPTPGTPFCPALVDGNGCYRMVSPVEACPVGTSEAPGGTSCRRAVSRVDGPLACDEGLRLVESTCFEVVLAVYRCNGQEVTINMLMGEPGIGTEGDDVIIGTRGDDTIDGLGGNDVVCALAGDDTISGGAGDDMLYGQSGNDMIDGGVGADVIYGASGDDTLLGGADADLLYAQSGSDTIDGGAGDDVAYGGRDDDVMTGGSGSDDLRGGAGADELNGQGGNDQLRGGRDDDLVRGGEDDDRLIGNAGQDDCFGGNGVDSFARSCETQQD